ncbi:MAG: hypothetical protein LBF68_05715 [Christensenellaceae bacterium]|jgi:hypothetical protein|nr:hypothetical protein [Christensenellaceae bacterium]
MSRQIKICKTAVIIAIALLAIILVACTPYDSEILNPYKVDHTSTANIDYKYPEHSEEHKNSVVDRATNSMDALLAHLDSDITADTGYYMGADITINTDDAIPSERSAFRMKLRANLYTYPYELKDENGDKILGDDGLPLVDPEALARHNELIKYNDIIIEWFDAMSNQMLIGFYFDGINPNAADSGNHLYLNLLGSKRIFLDFGDSVMYQQLVRLITHFDLNTIVSGTSEEDDPGYVSMFNQLLKTAITTNYNEELNDDVSSLFFYNVNLDAIRSTVTSEVQDFFAPFKDRFDPLTNKYLGFKFSTLGTMSFESITSNMQFLITKPSKDMDEMLTGIVLDVSGNASVLKSNGYESVPYTAQFDIDYALRISTDIVIDKTDYVVYSYGSYEFVGDLWIPMMNLEMDALIRTDINEYDPEKGLTNATNRVWAEFYDQSNQNVLIGLYYKDELVYMNIKELMDMYGGGIQLGDLGFPQAYKDGIDLADLLSMLFDVIDEYIVLAVDAMLKPSDPEAEDSFAIITEAITDNMVSTMKDPAIPESRNTMKIKLDIALIRIILREVYGTTYTNELIINLLLELIGVDLSEMALILGLDVNTLLDTLYIDVTYDVDEYTIKIEVRMLAEVGQEEEGNLILRLNLTPTHIGEDVIISFPQLENYKPLQQIQTYSAVIEGQIIFAKQDSVDLSDIFGAMIGDLSGKNTPYILPNEAGIYFTLQYDLYIRDQILEGNRWTRAGRSAIAAEIYIYDANGQRIDLARIYANDVVFDSAAPIDEFGYMWIELLCIEGMPKIKVREDLFIESLYQILGGEADDSEGVIVSPTTIIQALMEDSWPVFEPEVIRLTTSNQMFKNLFGVDELIADITLQVGFKQRVKNIDELESGFAMYSVGGLLSLSGDTMYDVELHQTIEVTFDFGNRIEVKDFIIDYDPVSITVPATDGNFYPATNGQFMGVMRAYRVTISDKSTITSLEIKHIVAEPIGDGFSTSVNAYYGLDMTKTYYTVYQEFYAYYLTDYGYYVMDESGWGYKVIFDAKNNAYIVDLGTNTKYDEAVRRLSEYDAAMYPVVFPDAKTILGRLMPPNTTTEELEAIDPYAIYDAATYAIFPRTFTDSSQNLYTYILDPTMYGYYRVQTSLSTGYILYDSLNDIYIAVNDADASLIKTVIPSRSEENPNDPTTPYVIPPTIISLKAILTISNMSIEATWDIINRYYVITKVGQNTVTFDLIYDIYLDRKLFYVKDNDDRVNALNLGITATILTTIEWNKLDKDATKWNQITWNQAEHVKGINYHVPNWESITIQGGLFYVEVIVGKGMMATYSELITMLVTNREVVSTKQINVNVDDETIEGDDKSYKVRAPVVASLEIDPYVYIIAKADYNNNVVTAQKQGQDVDIMKNFVEWFFYKFPIQIQFTQIYEGDYDVYNTAPLNQSFRWRFEYQDESSTYSELNISNHYTQVVSTYVVMEFEEQLMALELKILPRIYDHVMFDGETLPNTYTVDALQEATYTIPNYPTIYFKDDNGETYTLNFGALTDSEKSSILKDYTLSPQFDINGSIIFQIPPEQDAFYRVSEFVINWSNPKATNVTVTGNTGAFGDGRYETTAFIDIRSHVAPDPNIEIPGRFDPGFPEDWYKSIIITIEVDVPNKVISIRNVHSTLVYNVSLDGADEYIDDFGILTLDPYNYQDKYAKLPTEITVFFDRPDGNYDPIKYKVAWSLLDTGGSDNANTNITIDSNGNLVIKPSKDGDYRFIKATIGDIATIEITACIEVKTGAITSYAFYDEDDNLLVGKTTGSSSSFNPDDADGTDYIYNVDTFVRFKLPKYVVFYFGAETRTYQVVEYITDGMEDTTNFGDYVNYGGYWKYFSGNYTDYEDAKIVLGCDISADTDQGQILLLNSTSTEITTDFIRLNVKVKNHTDQTANAVTNIELTNWASDEGEAAYTSEFKVENNQLNITLTITGLTFEADANVYQYFVNLLSYIKLTLNKENDQEQIITDALHTYTLTKYLQYYEIIRMFDTKKIATTNGLTFNIYLGTGPGAQNCVVVIKNCILMNKLTGGITYDYDGENNPVEIQPYDLDTSLPIYGEDKPYVFAEHLKLKLEFTNAANETTRGTYDAPTTWYVESIEGMDVDSRGAYTELTWDILSVGGKATLSAMLSDGSRVYRTFSIIGLTIVQFYYNEHEYFNIDKYQSSDTNHTGGLVTIQTIYAVSDKIFTLNEDDLPSSVYTQDDILVYVPSWDIKFDIEALMKKYSATDYYELDIKESYHEVMATATVLGTEITLYVVMYPSYLDKITYIGSGNTSYTSTTVGETLVISFHQYKMSDYAGLLIMPESLVLTFLNEVTYTLIDPQILTALEQPQSAIPYTYRGHSLENYNNNAVTAYLHLPFNQTKAIGFQFVDLTVKNITINNITIDGVDLLSMDPYDEENREIPVEVTVNFDAGDNYSYNYIVPLWVLVDGYPAFELMYDTYRRLLKDREEGDQKFKFEGQLAAPGLENQVLTLDVTVRDAVVDEWVIKSSYVNASGSRQETETSETATGNSSPNSYYHFDDIFVEKVSDLPKRLLNIKLSGENTNGVKLDEVDIIWELEDSAIVASGQAGDGRIIVGYIGSKEYGQPIRIRIFVTAWSFLDIRKEISQGEYQIMDTTKMFVFSMIDDKSTINSFQLVLSKTNPVSAGINTTSPFHDIKTIIFYPSELATAEQMYRIIWDQNATNLLIQSPESEISAVVSLGGANGHSKLVITGNIKYRYDTPTITELEFKMFDEYKGRGSSGNAMYVVNPLAPVFGTEAKAYGIKGDDVGVDLGEVIIKWPSEVTESPTRGEILDQYLNGGVRIIKVRVNLTVSEKTISRDFNVAVVFLDMSPDVQLEVIASASDILGSVTKFKIRLDYDDATYSGVVNPYRDLYSEVKAMLNYGVEKLLNIQDPSQETYEIEISDVKWDSAYVNDNGELKNYSNIKEAIYVYVMACRIDGRMYNYCSYYFSVKVISQ